MKRQKTVIIKFLFAAILIMSSLGNANAQDNATITIGNQNWMVKNLDVSTYRNGDSIPQVQDSTDWANLKTGAWCYYDNDPANGAIYGKLYNWYAVNDPRGLAPEGWKVPTDAEWTILEIYLANNGYSGMEATALKSMTGWNPNGNGTDNYDSTALPGGYRGYSYGNYKDI